MKLKQLIAMWMVLCTLLLCFTGCKTDKAGDGSESEAEGTAAAESQDAAKDGLILTENGQTKFVLVHPGHPSEAIKGAVSTIQSTFKIFGIDITTEADTVHVSNPAEYEILVGSTNRPESQEAMKTMKYADWMIGAVGKKIVIAAGVETALQKAAASFATETMNILVNKNDPKKTVAVAKDYLLETRYDYPLEKLTVDGVDISEFVLVNSRDASDEYNALTVGMQNAIGLACGATLKIVNDRAVEAEHEILVGHTTRTSTQDFYKSNPDAMEFKIRVQGGDLQVLIASIYTTGNVLKFFSDTFQNSSGVLDMNTYQNYHYTEPISKELTDRYAGTTVRVMTNNVLHANYQPPEERLKLLSKIYHEYLPDFLCLQEFVPQWHDLLNERLSDEYVILDAAPQGKTVRENANPIFYRKDKYDVLEKKCFTTIPKWDDDELTYGVFRDRANGKIYIVFSLHWLVNGRTEEVTAELADSYRQASAKVILQTVAQLKAKYNTEYVFVGGDFNAIESTDSYKEITSGLDDAKYIAEVRANLTSNTGHTFGQKPDSVEKKPRNYDYVMVNGDAMRVMTHDIILSDYAIKSSDHCPVYIDVILK